MNDNDFQKLVESVRQMGGIMRGEDIPHRRTVLTKLDVKALRKKIGLTQEEFSAMIGVSIKTLQNWEQGRREPEGPAKALLKVVERDPEAVLNALHAEAQKQGTTNRSSGHEPASEFLRAERSEL